MTRTRTRRRQTDRLAAPALALQLTIGATPYRIRPIACDPHVAERAFRLVKPDGTRYDIALTAFGPQCDCADFIFRRDGVDPDGCKHIRALAAFGMIRGR